MLIKLKEGQYFGKNAITQENEIFKLSLHHYKPNFEISEHYHENDYINVLTNGNYLEKTEVKMIL